MTFTVGMAVFFVLDARIQDAKWLTAGEKSALAGAIDREDAQHTAGSGDKLNRWKMLLNPQILLLCGIYFSVQLSIYANTFWLLSIVKQIPGTTDLSVGFLSAIPWVCAVFAIINSLGTLRPGRRLHGGCRPRLLPEGTQGP
jgi:hypothetical protein